MNILEKNRTSGKKASVKNKKKKNKKKTHEIFRKKRFI